MHLDAFATLLNDLEQRHWPIKHPEHSGDALRLLSIMEELGEIARIIGKRALGRRVDETTQAHLEEECGDLLLNLLAAIKSYGVSPSKAIRLATEKWSKLIGVKVAPLEERLDAKPQYCNQADPMGNGCKDSWRVGGNYGSDVCKNPDHHGPIVS